MAFFGIPFPKSIPMHDWWLGLVFDINGSVLFLPDPLVLYRRHGRNQTPLPCESRVSFIVRFGWRLKLALYAARLIILKRFN